MVSVRIFHQVHCDLNMSGSAVHMVMFKCNASWEETLPGKLLLTFVIYFNNISNAFRMLRFKWRFGFHKIITGEYYNGFLDALAQVSRVAQHQVNPSPPQVMATTSWNTWNMYTGWPGTRLGHAERWLGPFPGHLALTGCLISLWASWGLWWSCMSRRSFLLGKH